MARIRSVFASSESSVLRPVALGTCVYVLLISLLWIWLFAAVIDQEFQYKAFVLEPVIGGWSWVTLLTVVNVLWLVWLAGDAAIAWRAARRSKWRAIAGNLAAIVLVSVMQLGVSHMAESTRFFQNDPVEADSSMIANFRANRQAFVDVVEMARADATNAPGGTFWLPWGNELLTGQDMRAYFDKLGKTGCKRVGLEVRDRGRSVRFIGSLRGVGARVTVKGYAYREETPKLVVDNLDGFRSNAAQFAAFRRIEPNWYLVLARRNHLGPADYRH